MWYLNLLDYLAGNICFDDKENAISFINSLFTLLKEDFNGGDEIEVLLLFGLIIDLYKFYFEIQSRKVTLEEFARHCIGLLIVHTKATEDNTVWCEDFIELVTNEQIQIALNIKGKDVVLIDLLKKLEINTLAKLDFMVQVELDEIVIALNILLNQIENQKEVLIELYNHLMPYKGIDNRFDSLIMEVKKTIKLFEAKKSPSSEYFFPPSNKKLCTSNDIIKGQTQNKENTPSDNQNNRMLIYLVIIPKLQLNLSSIQDTDLSFVSVQLKKYTQRPGLMNLFFIGKPRLHINQVENILLRIKNGELSGIVPIQNELSKIKIIDPNDSLLSIMNSIESYRRNFKRNTAELVTDITGMQFKIGV